MSGTAAGLRAFLDRWPVAARVEVTQALGSTPREQGAWMLVSPGAIFGTIGGGQLEFLGIERARALLEDRQQQAHARVVLDIPLGPEIGQCCGGRVELSVAEVDASVREQLLRDLHTEDARLPQVYLFGGGHVGQALAAALSLLPIRVVVVETRAEALEGLPDGTERQLTAVPEALIRDAPAGSAFVVLTHDHALDFLLISEALQRHDAAYVGMIGSLTKRATFKSWYLKNGGAEEELARLISPIGGKAVRDKRPAVIAALAAAEIVTALA